MSHDSLRGTRRFPVSLRYLFRNVERVNFTVAFNTRAFLADDLWGLENAAYALDEDSTVESMQLSFNSKAREYCPEELKRDWQQEHNACIRIWKCAAYNLLKLLPLTKARTVFWRAIMDVRTDISGVARHLSKAEEILDIRLWVGSRESDQNGSSQTKVQYFMKWAGLLEPVWEDSNLGLPRWIDMVDDAFP